MEFQTKYCKHITFGNVFFFTIYAVVFLHKIKYIAKFLFIKVLNLKDLIKSTLNSRKFEVRQIPGTVHAKYDMFTVQGHVPSNGKGGVFFLT